VNVINGEYLDYYSSILFSTLVAFVELHGVKA